MRHSAITALLLLLIPALGACIADTVVSAGRPCSGNHECGPGTHCDPGSRTCVTGLEDDGATSLDGPHNDLGPGETGTDSVPWCDAGSCDNPTPICEVNTGLCRKCFDHQECTKEGKGAICDQLAGNTCRPCKDHDDCKKEGLPPICSASGTCTISCVTDQDCQNAGQGDHCTAQQTCEMCQTNAQCQTWSASWLICDKTTSGANTCRGCKTHTECQDEGKGLFCDAAAKTCRDTCLTDQECKDAGQEPFCDATTKTCRGCIAHAECGAPQFCDPLSQKCTTTSGGISHVKCTTSCTGSGSGTLSSPYCRLDEAVAAGPVVIAVQKSTAPCQGLEIKSVTKQIYGEPGATIQPSSCGQLNIRSQANVILSGFVIQGNVKVENDGTIATLIGNTIGPSTPNDCIGVDKGWGQPTVILKRNLIWMHTKGGVYVDGPFTVQNNFIVQNGSSNASFGGVRLKGTGTFVNNTVADNTVKGGNEQEAAIRCEDQLEIANNVIWGNTTTEGVAGQLDPDCTPVSCDVQGLTGAPANGNISADPQLKGGAGPGADPWHLKATSPCDGKADPAKAPKIDYDGEARSTTAPDIGADEI